MTKHQKCTQYEQIIFSTQRLKKKKKAQISYSVSEVLLYALYIINLFYHLGFPEKLFLGQCYFKMTSKKKKKTVYVILIHHIAAQLQCSSLGEKAINR